MWLSTYVCLFTIYSCIGWIYETIFCTVKGRKWENRGFLYGPVCPIYGVASVAICAITDALTAAIGRQLPVWEAFLISVSGIAILEYVTSWGLEKLFHAIWWDYSGWPLNVHGRISLFSSLGFGCAGVLLIYVVAPRTGGIVSAVPPVWRELLSLVSVSLLTADVTLTVSALMHFEKTVAELESTFNKNMDALVDNVVTKMETVRGRIHVERKEIEERVRSFGFLGRSAIRRVRAFRHLKRDGEAGQGRKGTIVR